MCFVTQTSIYVSRIHVAMEVSVSQFSTTTYAYADLVTAVSAATTVSRIIHFVCLTVRLTDSS